MDTEREFLRAAELAVHLRVSRRTVLRWVQLGILPAPVRPTARVSLWRVADVRQALADRRD